MDIFFVYVDGVIVSATPAFGFMVFAVQWLLFSAIAAWRNPTDEVGVSVVWGLIWALIVVLLEMFLLILLESLGIWLLIIVLSIIGIYFVTWLVSRFRH